MTPTRAKRRGDSSAHRAMAALACIAVVGGCYLSNQGLDPSTNQFFFPTGLATSPGRTALYVTNSDFDLQFNGGTVFAVNLPVLRSTVLKPLLAGLVAGEGAGACLKVFPPGQVDQNGNPGGHLLPNPGGPADVGDSHGGLSVLSPGPCGSVNTNGLIAKFATIGAFASGAVLGFRSDGPGGTCPAGATECARLFVPVRGDPSITWFDVPDDRDPANVRNPCADGSPFCLDCSGTGALNRCSDSHRAGVDPAKSKRGFYLPTEPIGAAVSEDGEAIVSAHQTSAVASLVVNPWADAYIDPNGYGPQMQYFLSGVPSGPTDVAVVPVPKIVKVLQASSLLNVSGAHSCSTFIYQPGFVMTFNAAPEVDLIGYNDDCFSTPPREFLTREFPVAIQTNGIGTDSRGITVDASQRQACEAQCADTDQACLIACLRTPLRMFVANRTPASLLLGQVQTGLSYTNGVPTGAFDVLSIYDQVVLEQGPSNLTMGNVIGPDGALHPRVFIAAFDSKLVFDYDPDAGVVEAVFRTGDGPQALALDTGDDGDGLHSYLYVAHFTDSYLGVIDLDQRHGNTFGTMFATIGSPLTPKETK